jgi:hypothetical protein
MSAVQQVTEHLENMARTSRQLTSWKPDGMSIAHGFKKMPGFNRLALKCRDVDTHACPFDFHEGGEELDGLWISGEELSLHSHACTSTSGNEHVL